MMWSTNETLHEIWWCENTVDVFSVISLFKFAPSIAFSEHEVMTKRKTFEKAAERNWKTT